MTRYLRQDTPSAEEVRAETERILGQRKFGDDSGFIEQAFVGIWHQIRELLSDADPTEPVEGIVEMSWMAWAVSAALVALVVFMIVKNRSAFPAFSMRRLRKEPKPTAVEVVDRRTKRSEWLARAELAESEGLYAEAVHARFHATQAGLVERNELPAQPGLTAGEAREDFSGSSVRAVALSSAVETYSDVWFGGTGAEQTTAERLRVLDDSVLEGGQ